MTTGRINQVTIVRRWLGHPPRCRGGRDLSPVLRLGGRTGRALTGRAGHAAAGIRLPLLSSPGRRQRALAGATALAVPPGHPKRRPLAAGSAIQRPPPEGISRCSRIGLAIRQASTEPIVRRRGVNPGALRGILVRRTAEAAAALGVDCYYDPPSPRRPTCKAV